MTSIYTTNYIMEENIDFWKEINDDNENDTEPTKSENKNENENQEKEIKKEEAICLLTQEPLENTYIELDCHHKFNYMPLFNELKKQKDYLLNPHLQQYQKTHAHYRYYVFVPPYKIKCPYCRVETNGILPFIPTLVNEQIKYINDPPQYSIKNMHNTNYVCTFQIHTRLKSNKGIQVDIICGRSCIPGQHCKYHQFYTDNENEIKHFMKLHTLPIIKQMLKEYGLSKTGNKEELCIRLLQHKKQNNLE
jgi:hypothetical protein